jgi:hypothetical protein
MASEQDDVEYRFLRCQKHPPLSYIVLPGNHWNPCVFGLPCS